MSNTHDSASSKPLPLPYKQTLEVEVSTGVAGDPHQRLWLIKALQHWHILGITETIFRITDKRKTPQLHLKQNALLTSALPLPVLVGMKLKSLVGSEVKEIPAYLPVPVGMDASVCPGEPVQ